MKDFDSLGVKCFDGFIEIASKVDSQDQIKMEVVEDDTGDEAHVYMTRDQACEIVKHLQKVIG